MEVGRWGSHVFEVSANLIRGFTDLSIESSVETDTKKNGTAQYVAVKEYKPKTQKITVHLRSSTGCDVRNEAMAFLNDIGKADYFYIGGKKLCSCQMMLTQAQISNVGMSGTAAWTTADISCTFSQSSKDDGSSTVSSGGGGGGGTSKTTNSKIGAGAQNVAKAVTQANAKATAKAAVSYISSVVAKAKVATTTKKAASTSVASTKAKLKVAVK